MDRLRAVLFAGCCLAMLTASSVLRAEVGEGFCCTEGWECEGDLVCKTEFCYTGWDNFGPGRCKDLTPGED